ncbi:MAG: ECF transporter S component [Clostridium sp.]|uniref:ECF transporter S component n=1 Tax=Clostridium sp. TaxID=1506 RepID=UPI00301F966D
MKTNIRKMTISALLISLSILIPLVFGSTPLKIYIPPFTATLGAHVPMFIGMFLGPFEAVVIGIGSAIGFMLSTGNPVIALRAASHIIVGYVAAKMILKKMSYTKAVAFTAPIHGILEGLVVLILAPSSGLSFVWITAIGTLCHHIVDATISMPIIKGIQRGTGIDLATIGEKKKEKISA